MSKKLLTLIVLLIFIFVGYLVLNNKTVDEVEEEAVITKEQSSSIVSLDAVLEDVSGGNSSGAANVSRGDAGLNHTVTANLPDPAGSNFYEGWLVQQKPQLKFFSTGEMTKNANGTYTLSYSSAEKYEGYNFVVITLETVRDATPEAHIIEGLAK